MYQLKVRWGKRIKRAWLITTLPHQSISGRNQPININNMSLSKKEVLDNLDQVKGYINEIENKKEETVVGIAIKNRWIGSVIFQSTKTTFKEAVSERLLRDADLRGADLRDANLRDANLSGADLRGAELNRALFYGRGGTKPLKKSQLPDFLRALGFVIED